MAQIKWITGTLDQYNALPVKNQDALYFITDSKEIYKGDALFSQPSIIIADAEWDTTPRAQGRIFFKESTMEGKIWNGAEWKTVISPLTVATTLDPLNETQAVTGKAVVDFYGAKADVVKSITYDEATNKIKVTAADGTEKEITLGGGAILESGEYDDTKEALVLTLKLANGTNSTVEIPAASLVNLYEAGETGTAKVTFVTDDDAGKTNEIQVAVKISAEANNALVAKADGLFVDTAAITNMAQQIQDINDAATALEARVSVNENNIEAIKTRLDGLDVAVQNATINWEVIA